jgi:hypothetical protein
VPFLAAHAERALLKVSSDRLVQPFALFLQAMLAVTTLLGIVLLGHPVVVLAFVGVLIAVALVLAVAFRVTLRAYASSPERIYAVPARGLELPIVGAWALTGGLPAAAAIAVLAFGGSPVDFAYPLAADVALGALSVAMVGMVGSSLVDWYYVVPRVSGRICLPPCMDEGGARWRTVTQVWWIHRWVATAGVIGGILAFLVVGSWTAIYALVIGLLDGQTKDGKVDVEAIAAVAGLAGTVVVAAVTWTSGAVRAVAGDYIDALRVVATRSLSPDFVVGEYVRVQPVSGAPVEGYVTEIALEGVGIITRDQIDGKLPRKPFRAEFVRSAPLASASVKPSAGPYCDGSACMHMNERFCLYAQQLRARSTGDADVSPIQR